MFRFLIIAPAIILSLAGACCSEYTENVLKTTTTIQLTQATVLNKAVEPLETTVTPITSTTKKSIKPSKATESPTTRYSTAKVYVNTKSVANSARRQTLNTRSSALDEAAAHSPARSQERPRAMDCDLPVLPTESRLWRGNETHELNLPVTVSIINILVYFYITFKLIFVVSSSSSIC